MDIAKYYVSLGLSPTKAFMKDVDRTLKALEKKLSTLRMGTGLFKVDQKKLEVSLGNALDMASKKLVFEISHFKVDKAALQRAMSVASSVGVGHVSSGANRAAMQSHYRNTYVTTRSLSPTEWNRREGVKNEEWDRRREELRADQRARLEARRPRESSNLRSIGAGGAAGIASRLYAPAIAIAGGAYGVGWLNKRNQEVQSAELGANAVVQGGRGAEAMAWLKAEADRIGFDWLQLTPSFTGFMGAAQGTMGYEGSLNTFKAFNEFATSRHAPTEARKKALYGLQQMASMPNLMSQELFLQVGEAQGFGEVPMLFAQAYAEKMNSGLTGKEALYALKTAMKKGDVKTADVLPRVTELLSQKAAPTLAMSAKSSMSEQSRYNNALNEQVVRANKAGVETGYARLFRAFTDAMKESTPVVEGLAKTFDEISKYVSFAALLPQSFKRAFEGRDSWVADAMGAANVAMLKDLVTGLGELGSELKKTFGIAFKGWKLIFDEFGDEMLKFLGGMKNFFLYTMKAINSIVTGDMTGATNASNAIRATIAGKSQEEIEKIAAGGPAPTLTETAVGMGSYLQYTPLGVVYKGVKDAYGYVDDSLGVSTTVSEKINKFSMQLDAQDKLKEPSSYTLGAPLLPYETVADRFDQDRLRAQAIKEDSMRFQQSAQDAARGNTVGVLPAQAIPKATMELIIKAEDIEGAPNDTFAFKIANVVREQLGAVFNQTQSNFTVKESQ